ncbi:MAG: N-acetylmuramoyl-L-alanine amidase [Pseudanabaena sp. SU_2_4]|nr:N-acetylmuramoyl-L-alanine amidase [Pseudanabaena sp. SU_2_4]
MRDFATPVDYQAHDGLDKYCKFTNLENFVKGYWRFIERDPYKGWRDNIHPAEDFIRFIGPIYAGDSNYVSKVLNLLPEAKQLLAAVEIGEHPEHGTSEPAQKPPIKKFIQSPNYSSRDGGKITTIVVHYTTAGNVQSSINHFLNEASQVSAHYIIDKNGDIYQW